MILSFAGNTLIDNGEGIITSWERGTPVYTKLFEPVARGHGEFVKNLQKTGADHSVTLSFLNVAPASVSTIENRILGLQDSTAQGNVKIPDKGVDISNCVVKEVHYLANERNNVINSDYSINEVRRLDFTIVFRQVI